MKIVLTTTNGVYASHSELKEIEELKKLGFEFELSKVASYGGNDQPTLEIYNDYRE